MTVKELADRIVAEISAGHLDPKAVVVRPFCMCDEDVGYVEAMHLDQVVRRWDLSDHSGPRIRKPRRSWSRCGERSFSGSVAGIERAHRSACSEKAGSPRMPSRRRGRRQLLRRAENGGAKRSPSPARHQSGALRTCAPSGVK